MDDARRAVFTLVGETPAARAEALHAAIEAQEPLAWPEHDAYARETWRSILDDVWILAEDLATGVDVAAELKALCVRAERVLAGEHL